MTSLKAETIDLPAIRWRGGSTDRGLRVHFYPKHWATFVAPKGQLWNRYKAPG